MMTHDEIELYARLTDANLGRMPATPLQFFKPRPSFWRTMRRIAQDKLVVEFGAGRGIIGHEARERHDMGWACIDLSRTNVENSVHSFNALRFPLEKRMIAIACRPDHSGWVEPALTRALLMGCTAIYVGLDRNAQRDLGELYELVADFHSNIGQENENIWIFNP